MRTSTVNLSVTIRLAWYITNTERKHLSKLKASNSLVSHLPPHKLLCSFMPKVPPHPQLPTTVYFCTTLLFVIYSAYWCAITSNHMQQDCALSHYPVVRDDQNITPVDFFSSCEANLPLSFLQLEVSHKGTTWNNRSSSYCQTNSSWLIYNFTSSTFSLFLMSCWTDSRLPNLSVSLDFTERINTVSMNKCRWHWTWKESILSRELCEHRKLSVKPLLLALQFLCLRWGEHSMENDWVLKLDTRELVMSNHGYLQWNLLVKLFN